MDPELGAAVFTSQPAVRMVAISCAQLDGRDAERSVRIAEARAAILRGTKRAREGGDTDVLVVLPELWPVGFFHFDDYVTAAETLEGEVVSTVREAARESHAWVLGGSFIERSDDGLHNTTILIAPDGDLVLTYRKMHLFGYQSAEAELLVPGHEPKVANTPWGRVGAMTCYDIRFPELSRDLVNRGAELLLVVSAWPAARIEHWRALLRARAIENQVWVAAANTAGSDASVKLGGHSVIVAPDGVVLAEAGSQEEDLVATIDVAASARTRAEFPFLQDGRYLVGLKNTDDAAS
ncbi:MAG: carbon-nitrogen family hydrolase [Geodermatophilaceae bacterium]